MDEAGHISHRYDRELNSAHQHVLDMGRLIERQMDRALEAVLSGAPELTKEVIEMDHEVNASEVEIDEECTRILVRRQPAARDLRLIIAIIKTITDLERIGDQTERVARQALAMHAAAQVSESELMDLENLGRRAKKMLHRGLGAFESLDAEAALRVARKDKKVDREYEGLMRKSMTYMMEDPRMIRRELSVLWCARAMERMGDHVKNMAEYIVFLVFGKDVRHLGLKGMEREVRGDGEEDGPKEGNAR